MKNNINKAMFSLTETTLYFGAEGGNEKEVVSTIRESSKKLPLLRYHVA